MLRRSFVLGAAGALPLAACAPPKALGPLQDVSLTPLKTYSRLECATLLKLAGVRGVPSRHAVDCHRVEYGSHDGGGRPVRLSGLLALPRGVAAKGVGCWQHGTSTTRTQVPSTLSGDGVAAALVFAGNGYAMTAADYLGLGASQLTHTYYAADDTARAVIDLLDAVGGVPGVPDKPPFLTGFSQGGHASLAAHRELEATGRAVLGSGPVSGAFNLRTISLVEAMKGEALQASLYLAYMTRGLGARYGHPLEGAMTQAAADLTRTLFDAPHKPSEIVAGLPRNPRSLFNAGFLDAFDHDGPHWLLDAIAANEVSHFTPKAPVRFFYGARDLDVSPRESWTTARMFAARGADAAAIDLGPYDHNDSILQAAPQVLAWLESLPAAG